MAKSTAVLNPGLGLYLGQAALGTDPRAVIDGENFRVKQGKITNANLGWLAFSSEAWLPLNGAVNLIDNFFPRGVTEHLIFGTVTDLYRYVAGTPDSVVYLTPRYEVGTAAASGTAVTGTSTLWVTTPIKAGDEITFGTASVTDPDATWFVVASVGGETAITLTATAGTVADGPYTIRRLFSGTVSDRWSTDTFQNDSVSTDDLWLATNGTDDIVSWNGTADQVTLNTQLGFKCDALVVAFNMALYFRVVQAGVDKPTDMINSDLGAPLLAGSVGVGLSEQFRVHDGVDPITSAVVLGDSVIAYANGHVTPFQFVGDPFVFVFRQALTGIGPVGPNAVADFGDFHTFVGADAMYRFDGASLEEVNGHLWRDVIRQMDPSRLQATFTHFDEEQGDLIWSTPLTTDADVGDVDGQSVTAFPEHYLEKVPRTLTSVPGIPYSKRSFPFLTTGYYERAAGLTWADMTQTWASTNFSWNDRFFSSLFPQNLAGDKDGNIWLINENQQADGVDLVSFVKFGRKVLGSGRERSLLTRIYAFVETSAGNLDVGVWMSDHAAKAATLTESFTMDLTLPEGGHFVSPFRAGRFADISFGTTGGLYVLQGYDTDVVPGGTR